MAYRDEEYFYAGSPSDYAARYSDYVASRSDVDSFSRFLGASVDSELTGISTAIGQIQQQARYDISSAYAAAQRQRDEAAYTPGVFTGTRARLQDEITQGYLSSASQIASKAQSQQSLLVRKIGKNLYNLDEAIRDFASTNFQNTYGGISGQELETFLSDDENARAWYSTILDTRAGAEGFYAYLKDEDETLANWFLDNQDIARGILGETTGAMPASNTLDTAVLKYRKERDPSIIDYATTLSDDEQAALGDANIRASDGTVYKTYDNTRFYNNEFVYKSGLGTAVRNHYLTTHSAYLTDEKQAAADLQDKQKGYRNGEIVNIEGVTFLKRGGKMIPVMSENTRKEIEAAMPKRAQVGAYWVGE